MKKHIVSKVVATPVIFLLGLAIGGYGCAWLGDGKGDDDGHFIATTRNQEQQLKDGKHEDFAFAGPCHTGMSGQAVFLNASRNRSGIIGAMAGEVLGEKPYQQIDLGEYDIPQPGHGEGDNREVIDRLQGMRFAGMATSHDDCRALHQTIVGR